MEQPFLHDQRTDRRMIIGEVDYVTSQRLQIREDRSRSRSRPRSIPAASKSSQSQPSPWTVSSTVSTASTTAAVASFTEFHIASPTASQSSSSSAANDGGGSPFIGTNQGNKRNELTLKGIPIVADRYGLSDEATGAIITAAYVDAKLITPTDKCLVVDRHKVRRARSANRRHQINISVAPPLQALYFDGRKDKTKVYKDGSIGEIVEEHISLVAEPNSYYIGHYTPENGTALAIANGMIEHLMSQPICMDSLRAVGCDAAAVNVGYENGVIKVLENKLGRSLQWIPCLYHLNELPLRALIVKLDGPTSGPNAYSGKIGGKLKLCDALPIVPFQRRQFQLSVDNTAFLSDLRADQLYLYDMCTAILNGHVSERLAKKSPGKMNHARWLTTANRVLRLYVATKKPTALLVNLVEYILYVYAPAFFEIKARPSFLNGSKHYGALVTRSKFLPPNMRKIIKETLQRNAFFASPENILMAMTNDESDTIREIAWFRIMQARTMQAPRNFKLPKVNFEADNYTELIDWSDITAPPILQDVEVTEETIRPLLLKRLKDHSFGEWIYKLPCHSQAVERCVKSVTKASLKACGSTARHGHILSELQSRANMHSFRSKKDYNTEQVNFTKFKI